MNGGFPDLAQAWHYRKVTAILSRIARTPQNPAVRSLAPAMLSLAHQAPPPDQSLYFPPPHPQEDQPENAGAQQEDGAGEGDGAHRNGIDHRTRGNTLFGF